MVVECSEVVEEATGNTYGFERDEDVGVGDERERHAEGKKNEKRKITDGVI